MIENYHDKVKVDLNHPLAGRTLNFQGEIIESREASNDEMAAFVGQLSGQAVADVAELWRRRLRMWRLRVVAAADARWRQLRMRRRM